MFKQYIIERHQADDLHGILHHIIQFGEDVQLPIAEKLKEEYDNVIQDFHSSNDGTVEVAKTKRRLMTAALKIVFVDE